MEMQVAAAGDEHRCDVAAMSGTQHASCPPAWPSSSCHAATVPNAPTQAGISEMIELRRKDEKTMD
jgi:hypothetical protein